MTSIDEIGEKALRLAERAYLFILDILIRIARVFSGVMEKAGTFDRERLYPFFEKKDIEMKDYTIFKLQISSALFLLLSTLFIIDFIDLRRYAIPAGVLVFFILYILFFTVRKNFEEFSAYRDLFLSFLLLVLLLVAMKVKKPIVSIGFPFFHFAVVAVLGPVAIYIYFWNKHSREYTYGRIIAADGIDVKVKFNYDIRANVKPQVVTFRNTMNAKEGDLVKTKVTRGFLSVGGSTPVEIMGVEWV
jgi:uncharacterized membrane protein